MDLDLDIRSGNGADPIVVSVSRELTEADKILLESQPVAVRNGTTLRRLRDSHHRIAKLLADGLRPGEVSQITGYSLSRISVLQADPAMQELIAFYTENKIKEYSDFHARMADLGMDALQELHARLDEDPDKMDNDFLRGLVKDLADRTGHAPVSKNVNINAHVNLADRLTRARQRADAVENQGSLAPGEVELLPPPHRESVA